MKANPLRLLAAAVLCLLAGLLANPANALADAGELLYQQHCSQCHEGNVPRAPHSILFRMSAPQDLLAAMNDGVMRQQAAALSVDQREAIASYLAGAEQPQTVSAGMAMCRGKSAANASSIAVTSWGVDTHNTRFIDAATAGITRENLHQLRLKWVFDFPGATRARSQPVVDGNTVYVGSQRGIVYAIDLHTGCLHWSYAAAAETRSAISIERAVAGSPTRLYFGDTDGNVYALNASDGHELWRSHLDDHTDATITGSPRLFEGRLFVPMSSREWATAADPNYSCCTFRGGIAAFDTKTGQLLWKSYSISRAPSDTGKRNPLDVPILAPSGAPIWNSPTVDEKRGLLYVGTGESYSSPAADTSDSVIAFSIATGKQVWSRQLLAGDAWNMSCFIGSSFNCPAENGPDMDIGAPPILVTLESGKDVLVVGQKNGVIHGLDPDAKGAVVWRRKVGLGGFAGGIHWGMAVEGETVFAPNADTWFTGPAEAPRFPGVFALNAATGAQKWYSRAEEDCQPQQKPACDAGVSAPATAVPGLVFAGAFDGQLRAYDSETGKVLWKYQTNQAFTSVAGRQAHGGSIESAGPVLANGHLLINSGYLFGSRMPGNVLLAFSVEAGSGNITQEAN